MAQEDALARLIAMGFVLDGEWAAENSQLVCRLQRCAGARNILYAFVMDGMVMYVGKTVGSLSKRMQGYRRPGPSQSTNIHGNQQVRQALESGKRVEIYVLPDNGLLYYGGFHVNLAAGLEDSLVRDLRPPWNGGRKVTNEPRVT